MASTAFPSRDDFAALLNESLGGEDEGFEGKVVKGKVTAIENDLAVIDVGLKSEGRVALREFAAPGQKADLKVGDEVEVYVDRVENAMGEAMLSRDRARREAAWDRLEGSITILGEKGTVRVGGVAVNEIQEWQFADSRPEDEQIKAASYQTTSVYGFGHPLYYDNVIKTLRGEAEADVDGREGLKSLEVLIAAYRSARDGVRVGLPLEL